MKSKLESAIYAFQKAGEEVKNAARMAIIDNTPISHAESDLYCSLLLQGQIDGSNAERNITEAMYLNVQKEKALGNY